MKASPEQILSRLSAFDPASTPTHLGDGKTVLVEYSNPNVSKPLSLHHIRSTVLGHSLTRIFRTLGYASVGINHLGDWDASFGKLIAACKRWNLKPSELEDPLRKLHSLYVRYSLLTTSDSQAEEEVYRCLASLKAGDPESLRLWHQIREKSLQSFQKVYRLLGVSFDEESGESAYQNRLDAVVRFLEERWLLDKGDSGLLVELERDQLPPCRIQKQNGSFLHHAQDLAVAMDRWERYGFHRSLYVAESNRTLSFQQLFAVLRRARCSWASRLEHVAFEPVLVDKTPAKTRDGNPLLLEDILEEAMERTRIVLANRYPGVEPAPILVRQVGIGAVLFHHLRTPRDNVVEWDWTSMLNFDGQTGPFLLETYWKTDHILKEMVHPANPSGIFPSCSPTEERLLETLENFENSVLEASRIADPYPISQHLLTLARNVRDHDFSTKPQEAKPERTAFIYFLVDAIRKTLARGLYLLGLEVSERM